MRGRLLLVIPTVIDAGSKGIRIDEHFANNLRSYLEHFDHVTVACPSMPLGAEGAVELERFHSSQVTIVPLPTPYREDRYFWYRRRVARLLKAEIENADYVLVSPHSAFEWSTLAAKLAIAMRRPFDMEADWDLEDVWGFQIAQMTFGLKKLRKMLWLRMQMRAYKYCISRSSLSLLQGQDVFDAYKDIAPNPHKVLNVQITPEDLIDVNELQRKKVETCAGAKLRIVYAGRVSPMKGPDFWLAALAGAASAGVDFEARWYGGGELLTEAQAECQRLGLTGKVEFVGPRPREEVLAAVRRAHIFLFCHMTKESPRCVVEALAGGTPIVGFGSGYVRDIVQRGGGAFVDIGDEQGLASQIRELDADRETLSSMMEQGRASAALMDRDEAIRHRIELIKAHASAAMPLRLGREKEVEGLEIPAS